MHEAAIAHHFGLAENIALASVISTPAKVLGLDHRIGFIEKGAFSHIQTLAISLTLPTRLRCRWENRPCLTRLTLKLSLTSNADIVLWDSHPLSLGATPTQVFIDGILQLPHAHVAPKPAAHQHAPTSPDFSREASEAVKYEGLPPLEPTRREGVVVFTNVSSFWTKDAASGALVDVFAPRSTSADTARTVVVSQGRVVCAERGAASCATYLSSPGADTEVLDLQGGAIQPGLVSYGASLGLAEIAMEPSTGDGPVIDPLDPHQPPLLGNAGYVARAADGLQFGTRNALYVHASESFLRGGEDDADCDRSRAGSRIGLGSR